MIYLLEMEIFHNYVKLPKGICLNYVTKMRSKMWINTHKTLRDWSALDVLFISSGQLAVQVILVLQNRGLVVGMTGDVAKFRRNSRS